jgi:hypothetical protein
MLSLTDSLGKLLTGAPEFLSGALVVTLLNLTIGGVRSRRERKIAVLQEQLRLLYGPVSCLIAQNLGLSAHASKIQAAFQEHLAGKFNQDEAAQEARAKHGQRTTNLANQYGERILTNNARIMDIIDTNWHLADDADREVFSQFQVDYVRYLTESKGGGAEGIPLRIVLELGPIAIMRPNMTSVSEAYRRKRERLDRERSRWL